MPAADLVRHLEPGPILRQFNLETENLAASQAL
jgi:hypothetical protein